MHFIFFMYLFFILSFEMGSYFIDQAGFEITKIYLSLAPKC